MNSLILFACTQSIVFACNRLLKKESWARARLCAHQNQTIGLYCTKQLDHKKQPAIIENYLTQKKKLILSVRINSQGYLAFSAPSADYDVQSFVSAAALFRAFSGQNIKKALAREIVVQGDSELIATLMHLLQSLSIDFEETLSMALGSTSLGDLIAHRLVNTARDCSQTIKNRISIERSTFIDYWTDESPFLIKKQSLYLFSEDIGIVREGLTRLEKRIERLEHLLNQENRQN